MRIEFIIPTWNRPDNLMVILNSLIVQTNSNWTAHVIIDGITNDYKKVKDYFQYDERIRFSHLDKSHNDWGHTARNYGLDKLKEDWTVITSDDNYYVPVFVETFLSTINNNVGMVICDFVHNLAYNGYQVIETQVSIGRIDIGNVMYNAKLIGNLRLGKQYEADYIFAREFHTEHVGYRTLKIKKILYIHN